MSAKKETIQVTAKYTYNAEGDKYVLDMKHRVKPFVIAGYKIRAIRRAISNAISPAQTAADICLKYGLQSDDFDAIKKAFDLARDVFPLTDEEVQDDSVELSVDKILEEKRTAISQAVEKEEWKATQKDATSWREFVNKKLDPFSAAIDGWTPPAIVKLDKPKKEGKVAKETLVIGLSDLHYGASSKGMYMFNRGDWSTKQTVECVRKFAQEIIEQVAQRFYSYEKVIILGLGDLIHSVNGKTARGTELIYDTVREEQFEYALDSLFEFIGIVSRIAPVTEVHSVYGNHNYEAEMALFRALEKGYSTASNIKFFHYASRPAAFRERNTLFLLDHGADSIERAYVPTGTDSKLQLHVQSLLLQTPNELIANTRERLFVVGDKHHWEHLEYNDFQFIMFSTLIGNDQHAAVHNLRNRPRQSCLVIDDNGLKEVSHVYFDEPASS